MVNSMKFLFSFWLEFPLNQQVYKHNYDVYMQLYEKELLTENSYLHIYGFVNTYSFINFAFYASNNCSPSFFCISWLLFLLFYIKGVFIMFCFACNAYQEV